ncbi:NnrU family protein [Yoonia sp. R2331]|uniref:NnrU family protein n=1 Tax=Yoonia sp. R2331 TaxID=3237238 RepID=UPI0034E5E003
MILLILGLILWAAAHFWKRALPANRAQFGDKGKAIVALTLAVAIIFMIWGYRAWDGTFYWGRTPAMTGINNILMVFSFYLFAASGAKTKITKTVRHPQLTAVILWCVAHLVVNGDTPSFVLFGGLMVWAIAEIVVINRAEGPRGPYHEVPVKKEFTAAVATVIAVIVVGGIHAILGYNPFG